MKEAAATIRVRVNGEPRQLPADSTVAALLATLQAEGRRVAVERNGAIVPKSRHLDTVLEDGDRIEVVIAVGGG